MEKDLSNQLIIEALNKKIDHMSGELKKNFTNFYSWQVCLLNGEEIYVAGWVIHLTLSAIGFDWCGTECL